MAGEFVATIVDMFRKGDWKSIVTKYHSDPQRNTLLWVYPSEENFEFIQINLAELKCDRVLSVGCGSGLLEWMLSRAVGKPVSGIEVDGTWWKCKYAPPTFIDFHVASPDLERDTTTIDILRNAKSTALLFCYFNDGAAFKKYLKYFSGRVLIVIGPDKLGVHTDPKPFEGVGPEWTLRDSQEVRDSKDFIAIYCSK